MANHHLKTAFRGLFKNKAFTIINILGLSIGTSAALVIYLIVQYDLSFDHFEPGGDRVYRVVSKGDNWSNEGVPAPLHTALYELPGIEKEAAFFQYNGEEAKIGIPQGNNEAPKIFKKQQQIVFADGAYFDLFPHQWLAGSMGTSLKSPYQVVLSERRARLYFPGIPVSLMIGKTVLLNDTVATVVSGIVKDLKENTDFNNEVFIALSTIPGSNLKNDYQWTEWGNTNSFSQVMVRLVPGISPQKMERQIADVFKKHKGQDNKSTHLLQPLNDIHFNQDLNGPVSKSTLWDLSLLAIFILLLGAINFINLSTAQASTRAKEIGMRKILGSSKGRLIARFMNETLLLTAVAALFSILIAPFLLKLFSDFIPKELDQRTVWQPHVLVFLVILIGVVGFLSGFYPALVITRFNPLSVTKNQPVSQNGHTRGVWLRKALTVSQFVVAQVFIIGTLVVGSQIHFSLRKDMGFRKDAIVNFYVPFDFSHPNDKKFVLLNKLRTIPEIEGVSLGNQSPAFNGWMTTEVSFKDGKKDITLSPDSRSGDTGFISLYHIKILAGRNVLPTDSATELLVNETLARQLGFKHPADAVGQNLGYDGKQLPIAGVMSDFHLTSMRTAIHPLIFYSDRRYGYVMHVALRPSVDTWKTAIAKVQTAWKEVYPEQDFDYTFLDKTIESFYDQDKKLSGLLTWSAGIAVFISCLGLLGLVIFTANQRTKEIGIRKVLGATVAQIISLLSKDFIQLVGMAFLIAIPIAWWTAHQWLQNFAYHTTVQWWIFVVSGLFMLVIALIILCVRAGKAALANPTQSLRAE
jgi:putative ABC transport system permease protein